MNKFSSDTWSNIELWSANNIIDEIFFNNLFEKIEEHIGKSLFIKIKKNTDTKNQFYESYEIRTHNNAKKYIRLMQDSYGLDINLVVSKNPTSYNHKIKLHYFYYVFLYMSAVLLFEKGCENLRMSSRLLFFDQMVTKMEDIDNYFSKFADNGFANIKDFIIHPYNVAKKLNGFPYFWKLE